MSARPGLDERTRLAEDIVDYLLGGIDAALVRVVLEMPAPVDGTQLAAAVRAALQPAQERATRIALFSARRQAATTSCSGV